MLMMVAGTKNGEILRGLIAFKYSLYSVSMVQRPPMPAPHTARCGAVCGAAARGIGFGEVDTGVADGLHSGGHAVLHEFVHAAGVLGGDVLTDVEIAHLPAEAHRERDRK